MASNDALLSSLDQALELAKDNPDLLRTLQSAKLMASKTEAPASDDPVITGVDNKDILARMRLDGKVALVTGGGQGIGRAFCHALGEAGACVAVVDMAEDKATAVVGELEAKGIQAIAVRADVTVMEDIEEMVQACVRKWGALHIACNNAGVNFNSAAEDTSEKEWDITFNVNTKACFRCCQVEGRLMLQQGYGKIINTASMASLLVPHPQNQLAYNASKSAVVKITQSLACEWAKRGVRVNCMSPGIVRTPLIESEALKPLVDQWIPTIPAGRLAEVTDLQAGLVYLASDASDYMVGHNLIIEGAQSLW